MPTSAVPSAGVSWPRTTPPAMAAVAFTASPGLSTPGRSSETGRSFIGGTMRSIHSRSAVVSPANAISMHFRVNASASPSRSTCAARVALLRAPLGRPELPFSKGRPRVFPAFLRRLVMAHRWRKSGLAAFRLRRWSSSGTRYGDRRHIRKRIRFADGQYGARGYQTTVHHLQRPHAGRFVEPGAAAIRAVDPGRAMPA